MMDFEYDAELARKARDEEAREEGREEGRLEGLKEGRLEGLKEGRAEGFLESRIEMIKGLLLAKTPLKCIVAATGWSEEKILELADKE